MVPEVELNAANPDLKVQMLQSSERRGPDEDARRMFTWVTDLLVRPDHASELARALDVPCRHAVSKEMDHLGIETRKATTVPLYQLRLEGSLPIPRHRQRHRPIVRQHRLEVMPVAGVATLALHFLIQVSDFQ